MFKHASNYVGYTAPLYHRKFFIRKLLTVLFSVRLCLALHCLVRRKTTTVDVCTLGLPVRR